MSEYKIKPNSSIVGNEHDQMKAFAVGSGVVVCLYDEVKKTGGMCYTLFPDGSGTAGRNGQLDSVKQTLESLLKDLIQNGALKETMWAKIIGGATLFCFNDSLKNSEIGKQNIERAREWLKEQDIPVKSEDTGDSFGRSMNFQLSDGSVEVRLVNNHKYYI